MCKVKSLKMGFPELLSVQTDIDLKTPTDGKDLPALCVKVFRAGDFFLLDDLKRKATTELEAHLQNTTKSINNVADNGRSPEWLTEVFEALKEAYKDMSTEPMVKAMLSFVYLNKRKIFRFQDVMDLVQGTPAMAVDLMRNHLIDDLVTRPAKAALQLGIPVLAAVELPTRMYDISNAALRPRDLCEMPCLLYPVVDGFSSISSIFTTVIPETETTIESLRWMAPIPEEIKSITSNDDSDVVCVERETFLTQRRWMYLRFEDCKGAKAYVDRYCRENPNISRISQTTAILSKKMQLKMNTTPPDGHSS